MNVGIYIYHNAEVLDFSGPFEVFATANRLSQSQSLFNVFLVAEIDAPVLARGGYSVNPHFCLRNHPIIDILLVVGGVHQEQLNNKAVIEWIARTAASADLVASVCTGVFLLAEAGVVFGEKVTTHWQDQEVLARDYPDLNVAANVRWVDRGNIVTSGGISAGIDMSLLLVAKVAGRELAEKTAKQMEYDWNFADGISQPL